jgi:sensor histidine kinase YesM
MMPAVRTLPADRAALHIGSAPQEWAAVGAVIAVVAVLSAIRFSIYAVCAAIIDEPDFSWSHFVWISLKDFAVLASLALLMYLVIQPVRRYAPMEGRHRWIALGIALLFASLLAAAGRQLFMFWSGELVDLQQSGVPVFMRFALPGAMLLTVAEFHRREVRSIEAMGAAEAARIALETQTLQARLRTLEAQIEPHFLFNILANVRRLYEIDAAAGQAMLERLMEYLQMALPSMRGDAPTLGREAELVSAYLDLQKVRMGRRLDYRVQIPTDLGELRIPPMMLLTLVENAIKHGLAPQRDGGRVDVGASLDASMLRLEVTDTGGGFGAQTSGGGTGLANIRTRLAAMFGAAAELTLAPRRPHGLVATIRMPLQTA